MLRFTLFIKINMKKYDKIILIYVKKKLFYLIFFENKCTQRWFSAHHRDRLALFNLSNQLKLIIWLITPLRSYKNSSLIRLQYFVCLSSNSYVQENFERENDAFCSSSYNVIIHFLLLFCWSQETQFFMEPNCFCNLILWLAVNYITTSIYS